MHCEDDEDQSEFSDSVSVVEEAPPTKVKGAVKWEDQLGMVEKLLAFRVGLTKSQEVKAKFLFSPTRDIAYYRINVYSSNSVGIIQYKKITASYFVRFSGGEISILSK